MEDKEIKINVPEGYEIDKENSTLECIKFKPIKNELPKTWEEFCKTHLKRSDEWYLTGDSELQTNKIVVGLPRHPKSDKNLLPSKELAEAMLALCQLLQLRDCYNDGWTPDWSRDDTKYYISFEDNKLIVATYSFIQRILAFKSEELCNQFMENFKDLIEIAKPLL